MSDPLEIPSELPAMTLPGVVLFPKAMMPLYIFEKRYKLMLEETLDSHRMFALVGQREDLSDEVTVSEPPSEVASTGLIRVCKKNPDGTSFLILQGVSRIRVAEVLREEPYRLVRTEPLETVFDHPEAGRRDELSRLLEENRELGGDTTDEMLAFLNPLEDDEAYVDLVAFTLCKETMRKQRLLETLSLSERSSMLAEEIRNENERLCLLKEALGEFPEEDFDAN